MPTQLEYDDWTNVQLFVCMVCYGFDTVYITLFNLHNCVFQNIIQDVGAVQIFISCDDGTEDSISWVKSMREEDYCFEKKFVGAMRGAVESQARDIKEAWRFIEKTKYMHNVSHIYIYSYVNYSNRRRSSAGRVAVNAVSRKP